MCVDRNNQHLRCSGFEKYQPLIAMFWLAAPDETIPPTDERVVPSPREGRRCPIGRMRGDQNV